MKTIISNTTLTDNKKIESLMIKSLQRIKKRLECTHASQFGGPQPRKNMNAKEQAQKIKKLAEEWKWNINVRGSIM